MRILIENISVLSGNKSARQDIYIEKGRIKKLGKLDNQSADIKIDGKGLVALPAFVDMHCHLRDPGQTHKEDIISGARAAAAGGFCAVACMPNTSPVIDNEQVVQYVLDKAKKAAVRVHPIAAITKKQEGAELAPFSALKRAGAVALSDDGKPVSNGATMRNALEYAQNADLLIMAHSEDLSISAGGVMNDGFNSAIMGLCGISRAAEESGVARDIYLAESVGAAIHICHVSTKNSVELVRAAKKRGIKITCETCPHYFALTDDEVQGFNTNAKINPPLREASDVEAVIEGLCDGTIDAIATDHAPHHFDEKNVEFQDAAFGSIGFETAFSASYTHLVKSGKLKMGKLISLLSTNPAQILGIRAPSIEEGNDADLLIADLNEEQSVDAAKSISKSKNSVFHGKKLFGKVLCTIVNGEIAYSSPCKNIGAKEQ